MQPSVDANQVVQVLGQASRKQHASTAVHLVGHVTEDVFSFLGPLTQTLHVHGLAQTVILRDEPASRHLTARFPPTTRLVRLAPTRNHLMRMAHMRRALQAVVEHAPSPVSSCHFHGLLPSLVGAWAFRFGRLQREMFFSPHGSRLLRTMLRPLGQWVLRSVDRLAGQAVIVPIVSNCAEARRVKPYSKAAVMVESPVHDSFFHCVRAESQGPQVVAGSALADSVAAERFAQLAVLYWEEKRRVDFIWLGPLHGACADRLRAAGVQVLADPDGPSRVRAMSSAWVYISLGVGDGFPSLLAEAMASGVAAISWNQSQAGDYVRDGINGYVAQDQTSVLRFLAALMQFEDRRAQFGAAAKLLARERFDRKSFERAVLDVYAQTLGRTSTASSAKNDVSATPQSAVAMK